MYSRIHRILLRVGKRRPPSIIQFEKYFLVRFFFGHKKLLAASAKRSYQLAFKVVEHLHATVGLFGADKDLPVVLLEKGELLFGHK